jgi:hypothetical protein
MNLSKKTKKKLLCHSLVVAIIDKHCDTTREHDSNKDKEKTFVHWPPDTWHDDEKQMFDMLTELEDAIRTDFINIIENKDADGIQ